MAHATKAANSAEKFTGEDGQIAFRLVSKGTIRPRAIVRGL
ncbi:MAG: hypothetical protein ABR607_01430 [Pyrinomonadaceae bacterium]